MMSHSSNRWHAFNWDGQHLEAKTKRQLIDECSRDNSEDGKPRVRKCCAGQYELTLCNGSMWFMYKGFLSACQDGWNENPGFEWLDTWCKNGQRS